KLSWKVEEGKHLLLRQGSKPPVLMVVPDQVYPGIMWRIESRDGELSDMVNLSRAKDAATGMAMAEYIEETWVERRAAAPYSPQPVPEVARQPTTALTESSSAAS